jgi:hypothetical protein
VTALRFEDFQGLIPRRSSRLLPPMAATTARNMKLIQGEARGFRALRQAADFTSEYFTVRRAFRIPRAGYDDDLWLTFDSRDVDVVRSTIVNDSYDRYYWAGDGTPKYNTLQRIIDGEDAFTLGIPQPDTAPTVTPPGAGDSTRAYLYTFVSAYGEEGPPSDPTLATGDAGTWTIANLDTTPVDGATKNITKKRIYRTVVGNNSALYFFVAEVDLATTSYDDSITDDVVALNDPVQSTSWVGPPADLEGFVVMPNGYLVGWVGRRLVFSEPYRPHAWPAEYELSTEFEIVGLAVWGNTLFIGTTSNPYIGQGVTPAAFTNTKMDTVEPCMSRRSIVATVAGVYYASINGLVLANSNGTVQITKDLVTKEEWKRYTPEGIFAAQYGLQYIAFCSDSFGFVFDPTEEKAKLVELDRFSNVEGIEADRYNGTVYVIKQDRAWEWDPENSERLYWRWKSKVFHLPNFVNFGAAKIKFDSGDNDVTEDVQGYYGPYNRARFAAGQLNPMNGCPIGGVFKRGLVPNWTEAENRCPIGGSALYPINAMLFQSPAVRLIAYAKGEVVFDYVTFNENIIRLPSGFKHDVWQFEMVSNTNVYSLQVAETGKELSKV